MHPTIKLAAALDLLATCWHKASGGAVGFLPLGGDHFTQVAVLIIVAVAVVESQEALKTVRLRMRMAMHPVEPLTVIRADAITTAQ